MPHGKLGQLGRPATACRRPGWGTRGTQSWTTPLIIDFARDGLPHCYELDLFCMSLSRLLDTRRDATWMQLVHVTLCPSSPYCLVSGRCRSLTVSLPAYQLTSRPWTSAFVSSWSDSAFFVCVGVSCGYSADLVVGLAFVTSPACNCLSCLFCCAWGVGSTVPVEGGVVSPFTVSVNVYFRLTHVFLSIHYYAIHCISIHASS